jgi:hypothetical protein
MKRLLFILTLFIFQIAFGQKDLVTISGKITDRDDFKKQIFALKARLSLNDSIFIETNCDSSGNYKFQVSRPLLHGHKPSVYVYQDFKMLEKLFPPPTDCPYFYGGPDKYLSHRPTIFEIKSNISNYIVNLELTRVLYELRLPCISFRKNSLELISCSHDPSGDTVIYCIKNFLFNNPTLVIEIVAHSWDETNPKELSEKRANFIRQKLISFGIDSVRVNAIGKGDTQPLVDFKTIRKAKTIEEKEALKAKNREAYFKIISFDYDPKLKKRVRSDK